MTDNPDQINLSVGYTDSLIGVTAWPLTSACWTVTPRDDAGATLEIHFSMQPGSLIPSAVEAGNGVATGAADVAQRYAAIWYQIQQPDVGAALSTTLDQTGGKPTEYTASIADLRTYMTACYGFARDAAGLQAAYADPNTTPTLTQVLTHFGVDWQSLGLAAGERLMGHLVVIPDAGIQVPSYRVMGADKTPAQLAPPGLDVATMLQDPDNTCLPLQPGTELVVPQTKKVPSSDTASLQEVAAAFRLSQASLVDANKATPALLRPGFVFSAQGVEVEIPPVEVMSPSTDATLNEVAAAFYAVGVPFDAVMVAVANKDKSGMFRSDAELVVNRRLIEADWTLATNGTDATTQELASLNTHTANLFPGGTPLLMERITIAKEKAAAEPLGATARTFGVEVGDLLRHNSELVPVTPANTAGDELLVSGLPIPGLATLPESVRQNPPAQLPSTGDGYSPTDLASLLKMDPTSTLTANQATPDLILSGVTLKPSGLVSEPTVTTAAEDSVNAVIGRFAALDVDVTVEDLVQGNEKTLFLKPGAILLKPPSDLVATASFGATGWRFPGTIFPLNAWMGLSRKKTLVDPDLRETDVAAISNAVPVMRSGNASDQESGAETMLAFADALAKAIPGMEAATGRVPAADGEAPTDLFAVSFVASSGISQVKITPPVAASGGNGPQPYSYALRPLFNTVQSASNVAISPLDPTTGKLTASATRDYQGINLEDWAQAWLAGLDLLCTGPYAATAYQVNASALEGLLTAKQSLADAIADGLSVILADQDVEKTAIGSTAWKNAREVLRGQLLGNLVRAYDTTAVLQFKTEVTVQKDMSDARLVGTGQLADDGDDGRIGKLGGAKTPLVSTTGQLSFPFTASRATAQRSLTLNPSYAVSQVEFDITQITSGYAASDWLSFVRDFDGNPPKSFRADLGTPVVPMPMRSYPNLPALISQNALVPKSPKTVEEALFWGYQFTISYQGAAQDQLLIAVAFNTVSSQKNTRDVVTDSLFNELAQYAAIEEPLWRLLDRLKDPNFKQDETALSHGLDTYAALAARVASQWDAHWGVSGDTNSVRPAHQGLIHPARRSPSRLEAGGVEEQIHTYLTSMQMSEGTGMYNGLELTKVDGDHPLEWPDITIHFDGLEFALQGGDATGSTRTYTFPKKALVPVFSEMRLQFSFSGLHIANYQNAITSASVVRNHHLLGASGSETCSSFLYRTPELTFPEPLVPLIVVSERLDMGDWKSEVSHNPITGLFDTLFGGNFKDREVGFNIRYRYALSGGEMPLETFLPVALHPRAKVDDKTRSSIIEVCKNWESDVAPITTGGMWCFGVSMYSTINPKLERPLLQLKQLTMPLPAS